MNDHKTIRLLNDDVPDRANNDAKEHIIECVISGTENPIHLKIAVIDRYIRLSDIVPLAHAISSKISRSSISRLKDKGTPLSCHEGCSTCCSFLVPLAIPEVHFLHELVSEMPQERQQTILKVCLGSTKRILKHYNTPPASDIGSDVNILSDWYHRLDLPCPFLSENKCTIYKYRPLACREHITTSPPAYCQYSNPNQPDIVLPSVSILEALGKLASEMFHSKIDAIILPVSFIEVETHLLNSQEVWNSVSLVKRFVDIIENYDRKTSQAQNNPSKP